MTNKKTATVRQRKIGRLLGVLAPAFILAFGIALAVDWPDGTLAVDSAYAKGNGGGGGNGGGNGGGKGRSSAPGQADDDVVSDDFGATDPANDVEAAISDDGQENVETNLPDIAEDTAPASIQVIKELAGLPDKSALSEEEELEAIQSGWGTWRTADGPETIMAQ